MPWIMHTCLESSHLLKEKLAEMFWGREGIAEKIWKVNSRKLTNLEKKNNNVGNTIQGIYLNQTILCLPIMSSHPRNVDSPIITVHSLTKPSCRQPQLIIRGNSSIENIENCLDMSILVNTTRDTHTITRNRHDMRVSPLCVSINCLSLDYRSLLITNYWIGLSVYRYFCCIFVGRLSTPFCHCGSLVCASWGLPEPDNFAWVQETRNVSRPLKDHS